MEQNFNTLKTIILKHIIEASKELNLDFTSVDESGFSRRLGQVFKSLIREQHISFKPGEQERMLNEITEYFLNLGPIGILLNDPAVSEVMVNGPKEVYVEKNGNIELTDITFRDDEHLLSFIDRILAHVGRRISELEPYVDARLKDGSRINVVRSPVARIGTILTIRKFLYNVLSLDYLVSSGALDLVSADFLKACVLARLNIMISGGAGVGKTTLLNALASFIPEKERIISIEDTRELRLEKNHFVPLETRPPNIEGKGEITIRDLLRNALHMRPDRIIVGEVRSSEVLDMIQAMNTGHDGSMTTLHANSPLDALDRLEVLCLMSGLNVSSEVAKRQIISALNLIVHMARMPDGTRRILEISEVVKGKDYLLQDIFVEDSDRRGKLKPSGKAPTFYQRLKRYAGYTNKAFEQGA